MRLFVRSVSLWWFIPSALWNLDYSNVFTTSLLNHGLLRRLTRCFVRLKIFSVGFRLSPRRCNVISSHFKNKLRTTSVLRDADGNAIFRETPAKMVGDDVSVFSQRKMKQSQQQHWFLSRQTKRCKMVSGPWPGNVLETASTKTEGSLADEASDESLSEVTYTYSCELFDFSLAKILKMQRRLFQKEWDEMSLMNGYLLAGTLAFFKTHAEHLTLWKWTSWKHEVFWKQKIIHSMDVCSEGR